MERRAKQTSQGRGEAGVGLMEVIVGVLVMLIVGSILLHLCRIGFAMYKLNAATSGVAGELEMARNMALSRKEEVGVIFDAKGKRFGLDRNRNGRLDNIEAEDLPPGVNLARDETVTFSRSGSLNTGSKQPQIIISNTRGSRTVSVSSMGAIDID